MNVDVVIDGLTPCLLEVSTGKVYNTRMMKINIKKQDYTGFNFDWSIPKRKGYDIIALKLIDDDTIQGLIAQRIEHENRTVHVDIVETAPHNFGTTGKFSGVGAHLFAHACKTAYDCKYDYIYFDAKTNLIGYYKEKLGAQQIGGSQRMIIEGEAFTALINAYYGGESHAK